MADEKKTRMEELFGVLGGALAAVGVEAALKAAKQHIGTVAEEKAKELFIDSGDRAKTFAEVAKLMTAKMTDNQKAKAGRNVRLWIVEAWDKHEEGELTSLLKKVSDDDKPVVLQMLGSLNSYGDFTKTIRGFLFHDNALQKALKMVKQAETTGETIVSDDVRELWEVTNSTINNLAGAARPGIRNLTEALRRIR